MKVFKYLTKIQLNELFFSYSTLLGCLQEEEGGLDSEWVESAESEEVLSQSACMPAFLNDVKEEDVRRWCEPFMHDHHTSIFHDVSSI